MMLSACSPEGSGIAGWHSPFTRLTTTLSDDLVANPYRLLAPGVMKPVSKSPAAGVLIVARREAFNRLTGVQYHCKIATLPGQEENLFESPSFKVRSRLEDSRGDRADRRKLLIGIGK